MVNFLKAATSSSSLTTEPFGCVRCLVVGSSGVGKTSLASLITTGKANSPPLGGNSGCNVFVALLPCENGSIFEAGSSRHSQFFVELWDIGGDSRYKEARKIFYRQLNGVILVHDASDRNSYRQLKKWASEITAEGTFVAPFSEEVSNRNIGRLPVPVLVVSNKVDKVTAAANQVFDLYATVSQLWRKWDSRKASSSEVDPLRPQQGLQASALHGVIDIEAVQSFFRSLLDRKYYNGFNSSQPQSVNKLVYQGDSDRRLDEDDWV